jgi:16S rRNA processing protein RimM
MKHEEFVQAGVVTSPHGIKGAVVIRFVKSFAGLFRQCNQLWLMKNHPPKPYRIEEITIQSARSIVKLEGVNTYEQSLLLKGGQVMFPISMLPPARDKQFYPFEIIGYHIMDSHYGLLGPITEVYDLPQHPVAQILVNNHEVLIPMADDFIRKIDRKQKQINMQLPSGILEIYTGQSNEEEE